MIIFSLLNANNGNLTKQEIESSFGSNLCRCTGNRPILDAFKSFAKETLTEQKEIIDIEDILYTCKNKGVNCTKSCNDARKWCIVRKDDEVLDENMKKKIIMKDHRIWYRVLEVKDIKQILNDEGCDSYMLINGNTGRGNRNNRLFLYLRILSIYLTSE